MTPSWCYIGGMDVSPYVENLQRELARGRRRRRRRSRRARRTPDRAAAVRGAPDAARGAVGRRRRDHPRARARLRRGAPARRRAGVRRHARAVGRAGRAAARSTRPRPPASTSGCPSASRRASRRPPAANGCPSTPGSCARSPARWPTTSAVGLRGPHRPVLHRVGALDAVLRDLRADQGHRSTSLCGAVRISAAAAAAPSSSTCGRATTPTPRTCAPPRRTRVEFTGGHLLVKAPKLRAWLPHRDGGSIDVTIELPAGSEVRGAGQLADFHAEGELGDCEITTGLGRIELDARRRAEPQERQRRHRPSSTSRATPRSGPAPATCACASSPAAP